MLSINDVSIHYKKKMALRPVSFNAKEGEILGLIGADGSGKSSLLHAIAGILEFEGEIVYKEYLYQNQEKAEQVKRDLGLMPQGLGIMLYDFLSIEEYLGY